MKMDLISQPATELPAALLWYAAFGAGVTAVAVGMLLRDIRARLRESDLTIRLELAKLRLAVSMLADMCSKSNPTIKRAIKCKTRSTSQSQTS